MSLACLSTEGMLSMQSGFQDFIMRCEGSDMVGERNFGKLVLKDFQKIKVRNFAN